MYNSGKQRNFVPFFTKYSTSICIFMVIKNNIGNISIKWKLFYILLTKYAMLSYLWKLLLFTMYIYIVIMQFFFDILCECIVVHKCTSCQILQTFIINPHIHCNTHAHIRNSFRVFISRVYKLCFYAVKCIRTRTY